MAFSSKPLEIKVLIWFQKPNSFLLLSNCLTSKKISSYTWVNDIVAWRLSIADLWRKVLPKTKNYSTASRFQFGKSAWYTFLFVLTSSTKWHPALNGRFKITFFESFNFYFEFGQTSAKKFSKILIFSPNINY